MYITTMRVCVCIYTDVYTSYICASVRESDVCDISYVL